MIARGLIGALALAALTPTPAEALCIGCGCEVNADAIDFGDYNPLDASARTAVGEVEVRCFSGLALLNTTFTLTLSPGVSGVQSAREMRFGAHALSYNLYKEPTFTTIFGNGAGGAYAPSAHVVLGVLSSQTFTYPVHARLPAGQAVPAGAYEDVITALIVF
jgi:spore coat protein U-like protein